MRSLKNLYRFLSPTFQSLFLEYPIQFKPRYGVGQPPHHQLAKIIDKNRPDFENWLKRMLTYTSEFQRIGFQYSPSLPYWNNGYLPGLDMIALYTLLAELKPGKYIEIGSGNSTRVAHLCKKDQNLSTQIISIDPQPRNEIDHLADEIIRSPLENTSLNLPEVLNPGDILFVDNSHRILPNSDSMVFFMEILPRLKPGVIVHLHDIYLPYDYPQEFCERFYSEQYGLAIWLLANPEKSKIIFPAFFISQDKELSKVLKDFWKLEGMNRVEQHGGSFWFEINSI
jgi:hypothetical protein